MIQVRYSVGEEVEIEGSSDEFSSLRSQIVEFLRLGEGVLVHPVDANFDPSPYEGSVKHIEFRKSDINKFAVMGDCLIVTGSHDFLSNFTMNFPQDDELNLSLGVPSHIHYDRIMFGDFLDSSSEDVILTLRLLT